MADENSRLERARAALEAAEQALAEALDARARAVKALADAASADAPDVYFALPRDQQVDRAHGRARAGLPARPRSAR